ncbi:hypothetical protein [Burkholderia ubonensis]|uniref:hypothetical protein n=1 Tax=Burkholderia ubonensis TaxID=101571 RepID=UPI0012FBAFE5|nr:hypothetical protein [Burkholderia ubonensis]
MQLVFLLFQLRLLAAVGDRRHCVDISARLAGAAQAAENEMIPAAYFRIGNETDIERNRSESPRIIRTFRNNPESGSCRFGNAPTRRTRRAWHRVQREFNRIRRGMPRLLCAP